MALPGRWRLWWEVQWCPHGATGLGKDREKTPTYIEMWLLYPCIYDTTKTHLWEDLWCSLRGQTQSFSWGLCAPSTWLCELFWSGFSRAPGWCLPGIVAIPAAAPLVLVWQVWSTVQTLLSGYGLCLHWQGVNNWGTIMKVPLQNQPQWFLTYNKGTLKHFTVSAEKKHTAEIRMWQSVHLGE